MNNTPDPGDVVRGKVVPAAEELIASVAERMGPLAQQAVDAVSPLAQQAVDAVTPLAQQTREALTPYAQQAADAVNPYAQQAAGKVGPLAQQAAEAVAPYATLLREQGLKAGHDLADRLEPAYEAALDALSGARSKVATDVLPAVGAVATSAAASPMVSAATARGKALVKGAGHEPVVEVAPPKKKRGLLLTFTVVGAAAAATYVLVRKLVGDKGSQWQTARPTTPYVPPTSAAAAAAATTESDAGTDQQTGPSAHDAYRAADGAAEPDQPAEGGEAEVAADLAATSSSTGSSSSGSSVGGSSVGGSSSTSAGDIAEPSTMSMYGAGAPLDQPGSTPGTDEDTSAIADDTGRIDDVANADEGVLPTASTGHAASEGVGHGAGEGVGDHPAAGAEGAPAPQDDEATSPYTDEKLETELGTVEERAYEEPGDAVTLEEDTAMGLGPDAHPERYDLPGTYVGVEPPTGYTIKGNERSMKYHLPDSNSYARTIAEVWFDSEEAAQQAGFSRAQH